MNTTEPQHEQQQHSDIATLILNGVDHLHALEQCPLLFHRPPYNQTEKSLRAIAEQIEKGGFKAYILRIPGSSLNKCGTLLQLVEMFANNTMMQGKWSGLGTSLSDKIVSRDRIDHFKINLLERIRFADADNLLGNDHGFEITTEIEALFPELSFEVIDGDVLITVRILHR